MKKHYYLSVCIFLSIFAKSQSPLTIGQVYDYAIGDTICYTRTPNLSGPPTYYTQTFLQKTVKVDTLIYLVKYNYYTPAACQTCSSSAGTYTSNSTAIHLNSFIQLATADTCTIVKDTIYINGCGTTRLLQADFIEFTN